MSEHIYKPIRTPIGVLDGRNAMMLNDVEYDIVDGKLVLTCLADGRRTDKAHSGWYKIVLKFDEVLALQCIELDSWFAQGKSLISSSSLDEVVESRWIAELGGKIGPSHQHIAVVTYDDALDIICENYSITLEPTTIE